MERILILGFILMILYFLPIEIACKGHGHLVNNIQSQRKALIDFKNGLKDPNNRLSSWKGRNYCYWQGIGCENGTGFVISIDLHNPYPRENVYENWSYGNLSGLISPSLIKLKYLKYLDLSFNSFKAMPIPQFFGYLKNLIYLNLSSAGFSGTIPSNIGNLSNLQYLDLSSEYNGFKYFNYLSIENIEWMTNLVSLKHFGANYVDLLMVGSQWIEILNKLPNLRELHLDGCGLFGSIPSSIGNSCYIEYLDLSLHNLSGSLPEMMNELGACSPKSPLPNLRVLHLEFNQLFGKLPNWLGGLKNLRGLHLSFNKLEGLIPASLCTLQHLESLSLLSNKLNGSLPDCIGQLSQLKELYVGSNQLRGTLSEQHFWKLSRLESLWLGSNYLGSNSLGNNYFESNSFYLNISSNWVPPFQLRTLYLGSCHIGSAFPAWLQYQKNLEYLSLSNTNISSSIPNWFWNVTFNLQRLDLSYNQLPGSILSSIGSFCNLQYLDLSYNFMNGSLPEIINGTETCNSKSPLPNLRALYLFGIPLIGKFPNWLGELKNLIGLALSYNKLEGPIPTSLWTLQYLEFLFLGANELTGSMLDGMGQLSQLKELSVSSMSGTLSEQHFWKLNQLEYLDLYFFRLNISSNWVPPFQVKELNMVSCQIGPTFPPWLQSQKNLERLHLSNASISSYIPNWFWTISVNLQVLDLSQNQLQGSIPSLVGNFSNLNYLDLRSNQLSGALTKQHFWKLSKLEILGLGSNSFHLNISSNWVPPFQLRTLSMGSCHIGPAFPSWLQSQKNLSYLDLSNASISSSIPNWFWNISSNLLFLTLAHNQLRGHLPNLNLGESLPSLTFLSLKGNRITGTIPDSIGHLTSLSIIDFSSNNLFGSIPSTVSNCSYLTVLNLGNNNLSGRIPKSLGQLRLLASLHLNHNKLSGELPSSFQNLTTLEVLDLSYNQLWGQIPAWIGTAFTNLVILNLRSNMFSGRLPSMISNLSSLHVLDLAQNNLMGEIPVTLVGLKAMAREQSIIYRLRVDASPFYEERLEVSTKGQVLEYTRILSLVVSIDLSNNNFSGEFPEGITKLFGLVFLNLSMNHITGRIPESISKLCQLSSLDLSSNKLFGSIPSSMSSLSFLGYLNLSNNNFSGMIPFVGHMSTFTESAFTGNPNLCGTPLVIKCQDEDSDKRQSAVDYEDKIDGGYVDQWFYFSIGLGFAMGILVPYFVLVMKGSWCDLYFDFVDKIVKWLLFRRRLSYARNHVHRK